MRCEFRLTGYLVANQFAFGLYWKMPASEMSQGVVFADSAVGGTSPFLLAFYQQNAKLGSFGEFDTEWHTLEFEFAGNNSTQVTAILDTVRGTPFELANSPVAIADHTLVLSGITATQTYAAEFESLQVVINPQGN